MRSRTLKSPMCGGGGGSASELARARGELHKVVEILDKKGAFVELAHAAGQALQLGAEQDQCGGGGSGAGQRHATVGDEKNEQAEHTARDDGGQQPASGPLDGAAADEPAQSLDASLVESGEPGPEEPAQLVGPDLLGGVLFDQQGLDVGTFAVRRGLLDGETVEGTADPQARNRERHSGDDPEQEEKRLDGEQGGPDGEGREGGAAH